MPLPRPGHAPSFWTLQLWGWGLYAALLIVTFLPMINAEGSYLRLVEVKAVRALFGLGLTSALRLLYRRLFPGTFTRQAAWALVASAVLGAGWMALGELWSSQRYPDTYNWPNSHPRLPRLAFDYAVTLLGWSALYFGIKHGRAWQQEREHALRADALAHEARLASLRHQLHPHFLFNALTSVRALVGEDPARARRVVTEVAEFLRFSLTQHDRTSVPLAEELAMVRSYLAIEAVRFEEKLDVELAVSPEAEALAVPAFLLQPLVDNAVKHGMASGTLPVRVRVSGAVEGNVLRVEVANTGTWAPPVREHGPQGTGTGLRNVQERLAELFPGRARVVHGEADGWVRVVVELPAVEADTHAKEGGSHERLAPRAAGG